MEPLVNKTYMFIATAQEIWEVAKETLSELGNSAPVYEISTQIQNTKQGQLSVLQSYNTHRTLWQKLDLFYDYEWHCPQDNVIFKRMIEKEHAFSFLARLNNELDEIHGRILGREVLPSTQEVFSEVRREKTRRNVMLGKETRETLETESSALATKSNRFSNASNGVYNTQNKKGNGPWCYHCKKILVTLVRLWKLHGKPPYLKNEQYDQVASRALQSTSEESAPESSLVSLNKEQVESFMKLLNSTSFPSSSIAQKGNFPQSSVCQPRIKLLGSYILVPQIT